MFFHIGKQIRNNYPHNHRSKDLVISLDEGWSHTQDDNFNDIWFKGYLDDGQLSEQAVEISREEDPTRSGNFCVIKVFDSGAIVRADRYRSFPIYPNEGLTNLEGSDSFAADSHVMMYNDLTSIESKFDAVGHIDDTTLSFDDVVTKVDDLLTRKVVNFIKSHKEPIRIFLSGGIDTATLFSYVKKHTDNYYLIPYLHTDFDYFYLKNHGTLGKLWGYRQIHHWNDYSILASGAPGDEFTVRGPSTVNLLLSHHGTTVPELLEDARYNNSLHHAYFSKPSYIDAWRQEKVEGSFTEVLRRCCEMNLNDWQHWHLGNTMTWTPFRDLALFKTISRLGVDDLKDQIMNSTVQMALIKRNDPKVLEYLSDHKNSDNYFSNLTKII